MKKVFLATGVSILALFSSCTSRTALPQNPKDKEERRDEHGNFWIYNAALNRWAVTSNSAGNPPMYYYYPGSNSWTNTNGLKIDAPKGISQSFYKAFKSGSSRSFGA